MIKLKLLFAVSVLMFVSCDKKKEQKIDEGEVRVMGVYTNSAGQKVPTIFLRVIKVSMAFDSVNEKYSHKVDTLWGIEKSVPVLDSLNHPKKDSLNNPIYKSYWAVVSKDSVNTHVENIPLEILLKPNDKK